MQGSENSIRCGWKCIGLTNIVVIYIKIRRICGTTHFGNVWSNPFTNVLPINSSKPGMILLHNWTVHLKQISQNWLLWDRILTLKSSNPFWPKRVSAVQINFRIKSLASTEVSIPFPSDGKSKQFYKPKQTHISSITASLYANSNVCTNWHWLFAIWFLLLLIAFS